MKLHLDSMTLEITRKCNAQCDHCLRGEPENRDMTKATIEKALRLADDISTLTITGGEPSLNVRGINMVCDSIRTVGTNVLGWYIVTNGLKVTRHFLRSVERLHNLCSDNELSSLDVSTDDYHPDNWEGRNKLEEFAERTGVPTRHKGVIKYDSVIQMGRGINYPGRPTTISNFDIIEEEDYTYIQDGVIHVSCGGKVFASCNLSYDFMRKSTHLYLGNVWDKNFDLLESVKAFNKKYPYLVNITEWGVKKAEGGYYRKSS